MGGKGQLLAAGNLEIWYPEVENHPCSSAFDFNRCMPSGTRSNREKDVLFSDDPAHLERTIRRGQRSTSLDATTLSSIDTHNQPSTDTRPSSSIDPNRSTTIDITPLVRHEKLEEGDFEIESSMSLDGSQWCRPMLMNSHRSTDHDEDRGMDYSSHRSTSSAKSTECNAVRILTHEEFLAKHPHPPSPFYEKIDRSVDPTVDRQTNPPEPKPNPLNSPPEQVQEDQETEGRRLRKRKKKIPKNLKREANDKEMDGFTKRILRIPIKKAFDEAYFTHRLWMFFRETKISGSSGKLRCMPSGTRSNKEKDLLFSDDPAHLERTIRRSQHSISLDKTISSSIDTHNQPSTDTTPSSSTDPNCSTTIDITPHTSIDTMSSKMVNVIILTQDENKNLYDQDGHLLVRHEKLEEGDFEIESSMSLGGSQWCRPVSMNSHRLTDHDEDRWTDYFSHRSTTFAKLTECNAVRILTHEEFTAKHPHPPSPFYDKIDRSVDPTIDRQSESDVDRHNTPPIDRQAPLTYRVRLPSIDNDYINALKPPPKPLASPPEPKPNPLNSSPEPIQEDQETEGRRLRKRKEKIPKNLKREANDKEMDGFTKRILRIPIEKPFDEAYFTHRLWMFFRETKVTEEDIRRMFHQVRDKMRHMITLSKKSDPGKFAIPCVVKGVEFPHSMCDTGASVNHDEDRWTDYSSHRSTTSAKSTECNAVQILTHEEFAAKHPHPPSPFYDKIDRSVDPTIDRQSESDVDRHNTPPIDR
ncbi:hypothetical protein DY000_02013405 [Brassica cretica]|uniref:Uncharacterized protein n=1 Tax=Brassica cretica TaxID=69181 RepID=A0ABQ7D6M1_BRACR|nr:hypothetical protein DY000_02013405 [Brassica cretica]